MAMQNWARLDGNRVVETFRHPENPKPLFDPAWTWITCPTETVQGSTKSGSVWTHPEPVPEPEPTPAVAPHRTVFPPPTFLLLFTGSERVAIRAARAYTGSDAAKKATAAVLDDWFSIIEDPRLISIDVANPSTRDGLSFLVGAGLLTAERKAEIEAGVAG